MKSTPHELRGKCFTALKSALMSASGHMLKLGLVGVQVCKCYLFNRTHKDTTYSTFLCFVYQKLLRDNHFISKNCDPQDDQLWLLSQLIDCLSFPNWTKVTEEVQIEICKVKFFFYSNLPYDFLDSLLLFQWKRSNIGIPFFKCSFNSK